MADVRKEDVDALVTGATPQFSMQIKSRVRDLVKDLPEADDVRRYAEAQMAMLDALALGTTRTVQGRGRPDIDDDGWRAMPSHPRGTPLPGAR